MVGPCLLKQEREEAVQAVAGRLDFIKGEVKRVEGLIERCEKEGEGKKMEVCSFHSGVQRKKVLCGMGGERCANCAFGWGKEKAPLTGVWLTLPTSRSLNCRHGCSKDNSHENLGVTMTSQTIK